MALRCARERRVPRPARRARAGAARAGGRWPCGALHGRTERDRDRDGALTVQEHHFTTSRSARYYTLGPAAAAAREVWFLLHGYGQLAGRFLIAFQALDDGSRCLIAPEALSRFYLGEATGRHDKVGASWMTREDRLTDIADYVRYLDGLYGDLVSGRRDGGGVTVLGFSQGTATA